MKLRVAVVLVVTVSCTGLAWGWMGALKGEPRASGFVSAELARRVATAEARGLWGTVQPGPVLPACDLNDQIDAYFVCFSLGEDPFPSDEELMAGTPQSDVEQHRDSGDRNQPAFGTVVVSASMNRYPIIECNTGLPRFYTARERTRAAARGRLGGRSAVLSRIYYGGPLEQVFEFECEDDRVLVDAFHAREVHLEELRPEAAATDPETADVSAARAWQLYEDGGYQPMARQRHRVSGWQNAEPYIWTAGCGPTAGAMLLSYYDAKPGFGQLIDYYWDSPEFPQILRPGHEDCDPGEPLRYVPWALATLTSRADTWCSCAGVFAGFTWPADLRTGLESVAIHAGCTFETRHISSSPWGAGADWCWNTMREEIDHNRPFIWQLESLLFLESAHYVYAYGYVDDPADSGYKAVICYSTWDEEEHVWYYNRYCGDNDAGVQSTSVITVDASTRQDDLVNLRLEEPNGDDVEWVYNSTNQEWEYAHTWHQILPGGSTYPIQWYQQGDAITHANIWWSDDAGAWDSWELVAEDVRSYQFENTYQWTVPNRNVERARIRIQGWSGERFWESSAADGSYHNFEITESVAPVGAPILVWPRHDSKVCSGIFDLSWTAVADATGYEVEMVPPPTDPFGAVVRSCADNDREWQMFYHTAWQAGGYRWRVRGVSPGGPGPWSNWSIFGWYLQPPPVEPVWPLSGAFVCGPEFCLQWSPVSDAARYRVDLSPTEDFRTLQEYRTTDSTSSYCLSSSWLSSGTWWWRVCGEGHGGCLGGWSEPQSFTLDSSTQTQRPTLVSPAGGETIATLTPVLDWEDVPEAYAYIVQMAAAPDWYDAPLVDVERQAVDPRGWRVSSYAIPEGVLEGSTVYQWRVKALSGCGRSEWSNSVFGTGCVAPAVGFEAEPLTGVAPLAVEFADLTRNHPTSWQWDFGDGHTSQDQSPTHTYTTPGSYSVTLTAANDCGENTLVGADQIAVFASPPVDFTASPRDGLLPLEVTFTDLSTFGPTSWQWDFGDGEMSTVQSPVHTYTAPGDYAVSLTASNATMSYEVSKEGYIEVSRFLDLPKHNWAFNAIEACVEAGIVSGYPDGTYGPGLSVSRDQMAVFVARALAGGDDNVPGWSLPTISFPDVPESHWSHKYTEYVADQRVVLGYPDGFYYPDDLVNRGQMACYIGRSLVTPWGAGGIPSPGYLPPTFPDVTPDNEWAWCWEPVEYIAAHDIVCGYPDGLYRPEAIVTRDQMAVYIARAFELLD